MLEARFVVYCEKCGLPPEYCEYVPDFETECAPWLQKEHTDLFRKLYLSKNEAEATSTCTQEKSEPWTTEERLHAFYSKYMPEKLDNIPSLLQKYEGREEQLFNALVKKYGDEPEDPYIIAKYGASEDESEKEEDVAEVLSKLNVEDKKKRRAVAASKKKAGSKSTEEEATRILIQKVTRSRKKAVTIVHGMETIPNVKLKDASKAFSKRFAGSSSVKDSPNGKQKEIIIQGDHSEDVASFIVQKFKVNPDVVFLDIDGEFVPFG